MEKLIIIKTLAELAELKAYLEDKDYIAFDTETTGISSGSEIIGYSLCAEASTGYYVIVSYWDVDQSKLIYLETQEGTADLLRSLKDKKLIMHNAPFDCSMVNTNYKIDLMPEVHTDTLVLAHLLDENRSNGLKELGVLFFGEDSRKEQLEMKESIKKNGGTLTRASYELYKADCELIAKYGAKDAILTFKVFYELLNDLIEQDLVEFFYDDECMPLLKGPTYDLNTIGIKVDQSKLQVLKKTLESECFEAEAFIRKEIATYIKDKYPGTSKAKTFNIRASKQLAWLLFEQLNNEFYTLTDAGKEVCKFLGMKLPYSYSARAEFIRECKENLGRVYEPSRFNPKTGKPSTPKKISEPWNYMACGKESLGKLSNKYKWVKKLLEFHKNKKLLNTYVEGIEERLQYGLIRPSFLQHGTTSGRYSSRNPNFQNLPRDDKRIKSCIVSRPGKAFVGADYSQLEPRVFASFSDDKRLLNCFKSDDDFYSIIGMEVFSKYDCTPKKEGSPNAFGIKYKQLRDIAKVVALSATYGTTAPKMALAINQSTDEAQEVINNYFESFPSVKQMMLNSHKEAIKTGKVLNLFGRPRRMPKAMDIPKIYGRNTQHSELPYEARNILNLAVNHKIQSTGASIMNRAAVAFWTACKQKAVNSNDWNDVKVVLQVHDELVAECPEHLAKEVSNLLKSCMENTVTLPGVSLVAEPKIAYNLADLK